MRSSEDKAQEANKKDEEMKLLGQLAANKKRSEDENIEYERLLNLYGPQVIKDPELIQEKKNDEVYVAPEVPKTDLKAKNDFEALMKAYKDKTGKDPIQTEKGTEMSFGSKKEAVQFFKEQSKTVAFNVYSANEDHRIYSDGKGTFVHGTNQQVSDYLKNPQDFKLGEDGKLGKKDDSQQTYTQSI